MVFAINPNEDSEFNFENFQKIAGLTGTATGTDLPSNTVSGDVANQTGDNSDGFKVTVQRGVAAVAGVAVAFFTIF